MSICIEIENFSYTYQAQTSMVTHALKNISVEIKSGEIVGIVGQTGSGKSTLAEAIAGLLPITQGSVTVCGFRLPEKSKPVCLLGKVGMVFQYPEQQLFASTVAEDIAFGPRNMKLPESQIQMRVQQAMEEVGLKEQDGQKNPMCLSGGEKRKVAIAGVLAMQPEILILDEPLAGLDQRGKEDLLQMIQHYQAVNHRTVLWIAHSMEEIARIAHRVFILQHGELVADGTPQHLFPQETLLQQCGLLPPIATQTVLALQKKGWTIPGRAITIAQAKEEILSYLRRDNHEQ